MVAEEVLVVGEPSSAGSAGDAIRDDRVVDLS
jgi:hypothetical protein